MSETLNVQSEKLAPEPATRALNRGKTRKFRVIALVFAGLLAIGVSSAWIVYRSFVAYEATAARHVPDDVSFVIRFDLTHVMFYEPFRRSLFPLVERFAPQGESRRDRLAQHGIRAGADIREVLFASGPGSEDWLLVLGGPLPREGLGSTLQAVLRQEGMSVVEQQAGVFVLASGVAFAQAKDGAFVLASGSERLKAALPERAPKPQLSIGAGGFLVQQGVLGQDLGVLQGNYRTGSMVLVELRSGPAGGASDGTERAVRALLARFGRMDPLFERPAEQASIERISNQVHARILLPREAVERIAALVAARVPGPRALQSSD